MHCMIDTSWQTQTMSSSSSISPLPHVVIFPFLSKGHIIPLTHLAHLLHRRRLASAVTFFTTPLNSPFLRRSLAGTDSTIITLPFPSNPPDLPHNIESTDHLPSLSLLLPFHRAAASLRPHFAAALCRLPHPASLLITDGFLFWTQSVADELSIPCLTFYGLGGFASAVTTVVTRDKPHSAVSSPHESFPVQPFPNLRLTKADLEPPFDNPDPTGPEWDFILDCLVAAKATRGCLVNSFYELEPVYFDRLEEFGTVNFCVGPLCLAREHSIRNPNPSDLTQWLDSRLFLNRPVLYVAFGTQAELSPVQLQEIAVGLDRSGFDYLWVVRVKNGSEFLTRVGDRGKVVLDWVDQMEILEHDAVQGFMSHCGWNSVMESICMGVPILAWPMMAEQRLNAKFIVEELKMGLRVRASDRTKEGLVKGEDVETMVRLLMEGEEGKSAARRAKELKESARAAMEEGGSSYVTLERMIDELCGERK